MSLFCISDILNVFTLLSGMVKYFANLESFLITNQGISLSRNLLSVAFVSPITKNINNSLPF